MRISETELRVLISEKISRIMSESPFAGRPASQNELQGIDVSGIHALYREALSDIIRDIDNPSGAGQSFRQRLDKKLSEMNVETLSQSDIADIKKYLTDITVSFYVPKDKKTAPLAYWNPGKKQIIFNLHHARTDNPILNLMSQRSKSDVLNTLYHELFHATSTIMGDVVRKRGKHDSLSDMYKKELDTIINWPAFDDHRIWKERAKWSGNYYVKEFGHSQVRAGSLSKDLTVMKTSQHYYVALKQLRRIFPVNTITRACNPSKSELSKMDHWTKMLIPALRCSSAADSAFDTIASVVSDSPVRTV